MIFQSIHTAVYEPDSNFRLRCNYYNLYGSFPNMVYSAALFLQRVRIARNTDRSTS